MLSQSIIKLSKCLLKNDWFTYPFDKINHNYFFERFSIFKIYLSVLNEIRIMLNIKTCTENISN